ncbi:hypothetical protein SmJEL517_g04956 [Synchytrium microbalum]|uniref:HD domain-containing protein n=1 Tax=Synchytrium microbalum TaxID=1806994 RepID=A0A507BWE2_9FUNG|nr:uncharacterized protein SmJEL517_g04956 [Synchytrium microbalum]TPX31782.1 hypothetical protein SmJEL517_g04956 [Synchytrium microbalum]
MAEVKKQATFNSMVEGTEADWAAIAAHSAPFSAKLPDRVLAHLALLEGDYGGFPVDRLEHSLQTATRAWEDGKDEEYVVCALLHDIGDTLGSFNHPDIAAAILKPFVSEENLFIVEKHGEFQGYYFFHYLGLDRNMRDKYKDHPFYLKTVEFCFKYDQQAFDPKYKSKPLSFFEPMVRRILSSDHVVRSIYKRRPEGVQASASAKL